MQKIFTNNDLRYSLKNIFAGKSGFYDFVRYFFNSIVAEKPVWNWHIKYICDILEKEGRRVAARQKKDFDYIIINVPPGSSKSLICSEMFPLWCWTIDPSLRFICGSYAATIAEDISEKCFNIYNSEKFRAIYPELVENMSGGKTAFKNGLKGERYITSTGSGITGIHAHIKIIDDPISTQMAYSSLERNRANKWIRETLASRNVDADVTSTILIMQRLHDDDPTGNLLQSKNLRIKHICIPAELSDDVKPVELKQYYKDGLFDPTRKSRAILNSAKDDLGSYGYAGQMMQRPSPEKGGILKKEWFRILMQSNKPFNVPINFQIDSAYTERTDNDPTAILGYYILNETVYITSVISIYKEFPDLIEWLPQYLNDNGYSNQSIIYTEPKASGLSIVQQLRRSTGLNITTSDAPREDKLSRVHLCSAKIESGRVALVQGAWNESFINQCISFPMAIHDDEVDCLTATVIRELIKKQRIKNFDHIVSAFK